VPTSRTDQQRPRVHASLMLHRGQRSRLRYGFDNHKRRIFGLRGFSWVYVFVHLNPKESPRLDRVSVTPSPSVVWCVAAWICAGFICTNHSSNSTVCCGAQPVLHLLAALLIAVPIFHGSQHLCLLWHSASFVFFGGITQY